MSGRPLPKLQNYEILGEIGVGGMGAVYKVKDKLGMVKAIKVIHPELSYDPGLRERFVNEGKTLAALGEHPNIIFLWGLFEENNLLFIVMDYVEGEDIERRLKRTGLLPVEEVLPIFRQALDAIAFAHERGVIHRDIKPSNILLQLSGIVRVMDFGIARIRGGPKLTKVGIPGTPEYMAPELFDENNKAGANELTDIYALGVTLYEMVTAKVPFESIADTTLAAYVAIAKRHQESDPPPPSSIYPPLDKGVEAVILKALAKRPEDRYQTAQEFIAAIDEQAMRLGIELRVHQERRPVTPLPRDTLVEQEPAAKETGVEIGEVGQERVGIIPLWAAIVAWAVAGGIGFFIGSQLP